MTALPTPSQIASLDDERLEELAVSWRAQALRGDRRAFGCKDRVSAAGPKDATR
jgi:hypothetical protein